MGLFRIMIIGDEIHRLLSVYYQIVLPIKGEL